MSISSASCFRICVRILNSIFSFLIRINLLSNTAFTKFIKHKSYYSSAKTDDAEDDSVTRLVKKPPDQILGKVALITGGAGGIGLQYGRHLLHNGAKVCMDQIIHILIIFSIIFNV